MEQIEYTRTVVPSSMRSPYWKYFGFPSDNSNNILTRQKIVCTICNSAIAYNKNTSNLRTHLMSRHVEIFKNIVTPSNATIRKDDVDTFCIEGSEENVNIEGEYINLNVIDAKRQRIETHGGDEINLSPQDKTHFVKNVLFLPEFENLQSDGCSNIENIPNVLTNEISAGTQRTDYISYLPSNNSEVAVVTDTNAGVFNINNFGYTENEKAFNYTNADIHENHTQELQSLAIMLADLIQTDLLPLATLDDVGFCKYNQQLTGLQIDEDTVKRVEDIIHTRFTNTKQNVTSHLHHISHYQPYSLSLEIYRDNEEQDILNIYFNYINDKQMDLISVLYVTSTIATKPINISELLADINLNNCTGLVATCFDDVIDFVSDFTTSYDLPLLECLESMMIRCLQKIFKQTEFYADYKNFLKSVLENKTDMRLKKINLKPRCSWNTLNLLEYIFQNVEENKLKQWNELRQSIEYLKPLKMALDIVTDEPLPLCSLARPFIKRLFAEHFSSTYGGESRISKIQEILEKELYERIMCQNFLNEVTFFDTRFHRDFTLSDVSNLKTQIIDRYKNILEVKFIDKSEDTLVDSFPNTRKCSLKLFFKRGVSLTKPDVNTDVKTNLDLEFEQYQLQASLDLEQSPILWWEQQSDNYKQLSKIAKNYLTIPCCCLPRLCRITSEERYLKLDRRKNLSQFCPIASKLWYLYYNEDVAQLF